MSIRRKLLVVALLPLIATAVLAVLTFSAQSVIANKASNAEVAYQQRLALTDAAIAVGAERLAVAQGADPIETGGSVDTSLSAEGDFTLDARSSLARAAALVDEARSANPADSWEAYSAAVADLLQAGDGTEVAFTSVDEAANNEAVRGIVDVIDSSGRAWVYFAHLGEAAIPPADAVRAATFFGLSENARAELRHAGTGDTQDIIGSTLRVTEATSDYQQTATESLLVSGQRLVGPSDGLTAAFDYRDRWVPVYERASDSLAVEISLNLSQARRYQLAAILGGLLALALLGSLAVIIQRSITKPMQDLLDGTDLVVGESMPQMIKAMRKVESGDSLPAPVLLERRSDDELGDIVNSFNDLGRTAHRLAEEHVTMRHNGIETLFAYGERQARLLDRLLLGLNSLEVDETNIALLAKLGDLDHLASTMRRNAQSMVVLGGDYNERVWSGPVATGKIARASIANVEGYDRVDLTKVEDGFIRGTAAADLQHILAELVENGLKNSDSRSRVVIEGFWSTEKFVFVVSDSGRGMSSAELSLNTSRLREMPRLDQEAAKMLGLSVVGRLSRRHKIDVSITPKDIGLNALVTIPPELVSVTEELQVPASLAGVPASRTQRSQAQVPHLTVDTMPPGVLISTGEYDVADDPFGDESQVEADQQFTPIPPAFESAGFYDSHRELAPSDGSDDFKGSVSNKMAAAIEALGS